MTTKAFGYLRVSSTGQVEGDGFERQLEAIQAFSTKSGFRVSEVFRDEGVSGTTELEDRPAFQEMVSAMLQNGVRTIIIERLDRLAREYMVQEMTLLYLASKGIELYSAATGENISRAVSEDPMKKALVQIQGVFSELEKSLLVRRMARAREKMRRETGRCEGRLPYGSTEEEQKVIRSMRALRRKRRNGAPGWTLQAIADHLNSKGISTKAGGQWSAAQVYQVLKKK